MRYFNANTGRAPVLSPGKVATGPSFSKFAKSPMFRDDTSPPEGDPHEFDVFPLGLLVPEIVPSTPR